MARTKNAGATPDPVDAAFAELIGTAKGAAAELRDGAIRCSMDGCSGIVKPAYIISGVGLCPAWQTHKVLGARSDAARQRLSKLVQLNQLAKARMA